MLEELKIFIQDNKNWGKALSNHKTQKHDILKKWVFDNTLYLESDSSISRRVWHIINGEEFPKCVYCKNEKVTWSSKRKNYNDFCSYKCSANSSSTRDKAFTTNIKKYGNGNVLLSKVIRDKTKKTNIKKYGSESHLSNKSIRERIKSTNIERYGGTSPISSDIIKNKIRETNFERYGSEWFLGTTIAINETETYYQTLYGVNNVTQCHYESDTLDKLNNKEWLIQKHHHDKTPLSVIGKHLGVSATTMSDYFKKHDIAVKNYFQSVAEIELGEFFDSINIAYHPRVRNLIKGELDVYLPDFNIAIEYNGLFWHSERNVDKATHKHKMDECKKLGLRLITIFEDEWLKNRELVINKLLHILGKNIDTNKIYARKCNVIEVDYISKKEFFNTYHIQGDGPSSINYGLEYDGEVVAIIGFIKQKEYFILNRYATSSKVIGGFSKLLKFFEKQYNTPKIITFADLRWSEGELYTKTGFLLEKEILSDYFWCKGDKRWHKFNWRHTSGLKKLKNYDPNATEVENMHAHGFYRIWDCGKLRFVKN